MIKIVQFVAVMLLPCGIHTSLVAQDVKAIFEEDTPITWLGLDFSRAVFIGDPERLRNNEDVTDLIVRLNELMVNEADKYNIGKTFKKVNVTNAIDITDEHNSQLDPAAILSAAAEKAPAPLAEEAIGEIVSSYDFHGEAGIGLMFNIESFDKIARKGTMWVTFIDMPSKKVLFTSRLSHGPQGFGLRNYWAGSINGVMDQIKLGKYRAWRKSYNRE